MVRPHAGKTNLSQSKPTIVLAGGGHAHLGVLAHFISHGRPHADIVMVSKQRTTIYSGMLPSWMAGAISGADMLIDSAALAERAGVRFVCGTVTGLDAGNRRLTLASGDAVPFDFASLAIGGEIDATEFAPLGDRLLTIRPMEQFMARWAGAMRAAVAKGSLRLIVIGGGAGGVELSLAAVAAARRAGIAHDIALVTERGAFLSGHAERVRVRALSLLKQKGVAIHFGRAVGEADGVRLSDGHNLPADWVIAATGSRAPIWLAASGLATNAAGFVSIGADLRSLSHPNIFAAGDIIQRADHPLPRSGVHAVKAGPVLAANIIAAVSGGELSRYNPPEKTLYLLASGDGRAIVSYGRWAGLGRVYWWLKRLIDTRFVQHYARLARR